MSADPVLNDQYMTVAEAAKIFKVSQSTIWRWINEGRLPAYRVGKRRIRLKAGELARLVTPARAGEEKGARIGQMEPLSLGPLTGKEQKKMLAAVEGARRLQTELLSRRSGKPFPSSAEILEELREQRTGELG